MIHESAKLDQRKGIRRGESERERERARRISGRGKSKAGANRERKDRLDRGPGSDIAPVH